MFDPKRSRRKATLVYPYGSMTRDELIHLFNQMPKDSILCGVQEDFCKGGTLFVVASEIFKEVDIGCQLPEIMIKEYVTLDDNGKAQVHRDLNLEPITEVQSQKAVQFDYGALEQRISAMCNCGMAYTGARTHSPNCGIHKLSK